MNVRSTLLGPRCRRTAGLAVLAAAAVSLTACDLVPQPPQADNVSASVYGHAVEGVTSNVYSPGAANRW